MRTIEQSAQFKRVLKREARGLHRKALQQEFVEMLTELANDQLLAEKRRDHALGGEWKDHRDCHIRPDLLLIYRTPNTEVLQLIRLGSHSELGL